MKKQLLNESQIRKMMKIANITPLANTFIDRLNENEMFESALTEEEEDPLADLGGGDEDPLADLGGGEDDAAADAGGEEDDALCSAMTALKALKKGLEELDPEAAAKIEISSESEEGGDDLAMDAPDEEGGEEDPLADLGMGDDEEEALAEANIYLAESRRPSIRAPFKRTRQKRSTQAQIVSEVTRRVASRLMSMKNRNRR